MASLEPFRLSGNELVAVLTSVVPQKTLWSSLRIMGLLSDVSDYEMISDTFPPSEETVIRGTQSLIDRGLMTVENGRPRLDPSIEAVGLAFSAPEAVITYQSSSEAVEFTSVIVDTASAYRVVLDFVHGSSYEVTLTRKDSAIIDFFTHIAKTISKNFQTYLLDVTYMTKQDDILNIYLVSTYHAPTDLLKSLDLPGEGYWVVTADLPNEGDISRVYQIDGEEEEMSVFQRRFDSFDEGAESIQLRFLLETQEIEAELSNEYLI